MISPIHSGEYHRRISVILISYLRSRIGSDRIGSARPGGLGEYLRASIISADLPLRLDRSPAGPRLKFTPSQTEGEVATVRGTEPQSQINTLVKWLVALFKVTHLLFIYDTAIFSILAVAVAVLDSSAVSATAESNTAWFFLRGL